MGNGSFFQGLVSGINQGISDTRKQNQKLAEDEIAGEQTILTHLLTTSEDQNIIESAASALLNLHQSGKPTGFLGKLTAKRGENEDIAKLIAASHPARQKALAKQAAVQNPPAEEVQQSPAPMTFGAPQQDPTAPPVAPLPVAEAGPAALPINTSKQQSQIGFSAGAPGTPPQAFAPPPPAATTPPAAAPLSAPPPPPPAGSGAISSLPPGGDEYQNKYGLLSPLQKQQALENIRGDRTPTSALAMAFKTIEELVPLEANETITAGQQAQLDAARKFTAKAPPKPPAPPAVGSQEDFITKKYGPNATPEQIAEGVKAYSALNDRPVDPMLAQIRAISIANLQKAQNSLSPAQFRMAQGFADDYARDSKDYITRLQSYQGIKAGAANPSAAGDIAMIYNFMRMQDPTSTVREGEYATAQKAAGVPEIIRNQYNKLLTGQRLTPGQRVDFLTVAQQQFGAAQTRQRGLIETYTGRAKRAGINPEDAVVDYDKVFGITGKTNKSIADVEKELGLVATPTPTKK